ncbi:MAG: hypothetical protein HY291_02010 [Planctomycetes bacterium]|nr:hypothetical protein [Planctomycetota bacterium]
MRVCLFVAGLVLSTLAGKGQATDFVDLAYQRATLDQKPEEWDKFVRKTKEHFETWSNDNPSGSGNVNRFLNDKLLPIAMGVPGGEVKNLKKFIYWIALYKVFDAQPPWYILEIAKENQQDIEDLHKDFSWERMSKLVKQRANEMPEDRKKKLQERMKKDKD